MHLGLRGGIGGLIWAGLVSVPWACRSDPLSAIRTIEEFDKELYELRLVYGLNQSLTFTRGVNFFGCGSWIARAGYRLSRLGGYVGTLACGPRPRSAIRTIEEFRMNS